MSKVHIALKDTAHLFCLCNRVFALASLQAFLESTRSARVNNAVFKSVRWLADEISERRVFFPFLYVGKQKKNPSFGL